VSGPVNREAAYRGVVTDPRIPSAEACEELVAATLVAPEGEWRSREGALLVRAVDWALAEKARADAAERELVAAKDRERELSRRIRVALGLPKETP
jgi:hypothetical protein